MPDDTRIDRWLCAVRLVKTRPIATQLCDGGHVRVNGNPAKPSTKVRGGDVVHAFIAERQAESIYRRVIGIKEAQLGHDSATLAVPLNNLATVLHAQGGRVEAAVLYDRATTLLEGAVRDDHPNLLAIRRSAARLAAGGDRSG